MCCIYHKPRPIGESSSESESSDSSSSDTDSDGEVGQCDGQVSPSHRARSASAEPSGDASELPKQRGRGTYCQKHRATGERRKPSPNAYEKMPKAGKRHVKKEKPG